MNQPIFDTSDIEYLATHFDISQLRLEQKSARAKASLARDNQDTAGELYYGDYAKAVSLAISYLCSLQPKHYDR